LICIPRAESAIAASRIRDAAAAGIPVADMPLRRPLQRPRAAACNAGENRVRGRFADSQMLAELLAVLRDDRLLRELDRAVDDRLARDRLQDRLAAAADRQRR
jgi:hypothetical protein